MGREISVTVRCPRGCAMVVLAHFHRVSVKEERHAAVVTHERATHNYQENIVAEEQRQRRRGRANIRGKPQRWPAEEGKCVEAPRIFVPPSDRKGGAIPRSSDFGRIAHAAPQQRDRGERSEARAERKPKA